MKQLRLPLAVAAGLMVATLGSRAMASSCSYDSPSGVVSIQVTGTASISLLATGIRLDNVKCSTATINNAEIVNVVGSTGIDKVTVTGTYGPGRTTEAGSSELEMTFALDAGVDQLIIKLTAGADVVDFTATGMDLAADGDEDIALGHTETTRVYGKDGDDLFDASAFVDTVDYAVKLYLYGDNGSDLLIGSAGSDWLYGGAGDDDLDGQAGNDYFYGDADNDFLDGGDGNDKFYELTASNGGDIMVGGLGKDTADYGKRTLAVNVTIGAGADDGEAGEGDDVGADVENANGGAGNDTLVGNALGNTLKGGAGDDDLSGDAGIDYLYGDAGEDIIDGGAQGDKLYGGADNDVILGGSGKDTYDAGDGDDFVFNADGVVNEVVNCGLGADEAELEADLFTGCEITS